MQLVEIDVSLLPPPEPMGKILAALAQLKPTQCLLITHSREPYPLYEKLNASGWEYHCHKLTHATVKLYIFKKRDQALFDLLLSHTYWDTP